MAYELVILAALSIGFLLLFPRRPILVDMALALFGLGLVLLNLNYTRTEIWGQWPREIERGRAPRGILVTMALTAVAVLLFLLVAVAIGYRGADWPGAAARIFHPKLPIAILLYLPWAFVQQTLFQFYLLGRLRTLFPCLHPFLQSALNGLIFGAVHLGDIRIAVLTALAGTLWSLVYLRYRCLWPLAVSHALVGTTFYYWVYGSDLASQWSAFFATVLSQR
ncbi:CPBP family glutamic-type intramembrane protease [Candidatus Nitrospira bockiana]